MIMTTQGSPEGLAKAPSVGKWEELTLAHLTVGRTEVRSDLDTFKLPQCIRQAGKRPESGACPRNLFL